MKLDDRVYIPNWDYRTSRDFQMMNPNGRGIYVDQLVRRGAIKHIGDKSITVKFPGGRRVTVIKHMVHKTKEQCYRCLGALVGNEEW